MNCSTLLAGRPIEDRLRFATEAGFSAVEFWWPFAEAEPSEREVDRFVAALDTSGAELVALNLFAGDMAAGERGILSSPGREAELLASARTAANISERLGVKRFNVLYGNRRADHLPSAQDAAADQTLRRVAEVLGAIDGVAMIEAVSGVPDYPIKTAADAAAVVARAGVDAAANIGILLDLYHLAANGDDVEDAIEQYGATAAHVQLADLPGRGVPGSGALPLATYVSRLRALGYDGWVALEYPDAEGTSLTQLTTQERKALA